MLCLSCCVVTYLDVMLSYCVFDIFGCYVACHVVYLTYLDVMMLCCLSCRVFNIFGCYVACHVVYLT